MGYFLDLHRGAATVAQLPTGTYFAYDDIETLACSHHHHRFQHHCEIFQKV